MTLFKKLTGFIDRKLNPLPPRDHWTCRVGDLIIGPDWTSKIRDVHDAEETIKIETEDGPESVVILYRDLWLENEKVIRVELLDSPDHTQKVSLVLFSEIWEGSFDDAKSQGVVASLESENGLLEDDENRVYQLLSRHELLMRGPYGDEAVKESWYRLATCGDPTTTDSLLCVTIDKYGWHVVHRGNQVLPEIYQVIEGTK